MSQDTALREVVEGRDELPEGVRLHVALDLLRALDVDEPLAPRTPASRCRFQRVRIGEDGRARLDGEGDATGAGLLLWEVLATRAAADDADVAALPRVHDVVDAIPPDVDDLVAAILGGTSEIETVGELARALVEAAGGAIGVAADVRAALGFAPEEAAAPVTPVEVAPPLAPPPRAAERPSVRAPALSYEAHEAPRSPSVRPTASVPPRGSVPPHASWSALDTGPLSDRMTPAPPAPAKARTPSRPPRGSSPPGRASQAPTPFPAHVLLGSEPPIAASSAPPPAPGAHTMRASPTIYAFQHDDEGASGAPPSLEAADAPISSRGGASAPPSERASGAVPRSPHGTSAAPRDDDLDALADWGFLSRPPPPAPPAERERGPTTGEWDLGALGGGSASEVPEASGERGPPTPRPPSVKLQPLVLLVKSDEDENGVIATMIRTGGYSVVVRPTADEGMRAAAHVLPDVLVVDNDLADDSGDHFVRKVRSSGTKLAATPIVLLASPADTRTRVARFAIGADVSILKPARYADLIGQIDALVKMSSRLRSARKALPHISSSGDKVFAGDLAQISISAMLTILEMERRSGVFDVRSDGRRVQLEIVAGRMTAGIAQGQPVGPLETLRVVLRWTSGYFSFRTIPLRAPPPDASTITALLGEALRMQDEEDHPEQIAKKR
ncbi:MAG TPA: DUF4388 domain-containing protein [Byssovorax sp.]